jgi:hypothetical protein
MGSSACGAEPARQDCRLGHRLPLRCREGRQFRSSGWCRNDCCL